MVWRAVFQFSAVILWIINEQTKGQTILLSSISVLQWLVGTALIAGGQVLPDPTPRIMTSVVQCIPDNSHLRCRH